MSDELKSGLITIGIALVIAGLVGISIYCPVVAIVSIWILLFIWFVLTMWCSYELILDIIKDRKWRKQK